MVDSTYSVLTRAFRLTGSLEIHSIYNQMRLSCCWVIVYLPVFAAEQLSHGLLPVHWLWLVCLRFKAVIQTGTLTFCFRNRHRRQANAFCLFLDGATLFLSIRTRHLAAQ